MALSDVPDGTTLYLDANILVYHFLGESAECSDLLGRVASGDVRGWMGTHTLAEVAHRLMLIEAQSQGLVTSGNPARKLAKRPELLAGLADYQPKVDAVPRLLTDIWPLTLETIERSAAVRSRHGLLVNDSLTVAMMELRGTQALATADRDFLRLSGLQVYTPTDL